MDESNLEHWPEEARSKIKMSEADLDELYKLDYEDVIGGDIPCRFHYTKVAPADYGLTIEEILNRPEKELRQLVPMSKLQPYRDDGATDQKWWTMPQNRKDLVQKRMAAVQGKAKKDAAAKALLKGQQAQGGFDVDAPVAKKKKKKNKRKAEDMQEGSEGATTAGAARDSKPKKAKKAKGEASAAAAAPASKKSKKKQLL